MLLSKEELSEIRAQAGSRTAQYQYMVPKLLGHIASLEAAAQAKKAPAKKAPAKKAPAKKAPAKKAASKKK